MTGRQPEGHAAHTELGPTRARALAVLVELGARGEAGTVSAVARQLGGHVNTARFHLEALVEAGLAERVDDVPNGPGRPRATYVATAAAPAAPPRSYQLLAEILATHIAATAGDPSEVAADAGRAWGRYAAESRPPAATDRTTAAPHGGPEHEGTAGDRGEVGAAARVVVRALAEIGFDSSVVEADQEDGERTIEVTSCPFLEVASGHLEVVCAVHRGIMEGLLEQSGSDTTVTRLDPLVGPSRCLARLGPRRPGRARPGARSR